jgi:tetraacyldisaccharide 4'-kinase
LLHAEKAPVATFSVGGLEVGGSGKTPVTALLLRALATSGRHPGLLTRGYGRPRGDLVVRLPGEAAEAEAIGDEPAMLVGGGLDVPVAACPSRRLGARALVAAGVGCLVLDDGFSHRALARDLDIVVLRGERPFGNGHLLPWGTLREPPSSLGRAHIVWLHFRDRAQLCVDKPSWWDRLASASAACVVSVAEPTGAHDAAGNPAQLAGARVVAAAGIASPGDFFASLASLGAEVVESYALADHRRYSCQDVEVLVRTVSAVGAQALVVTPKDAVKVAPLWPAASVPLWVLGTQPAIVCGGDILAARLGIAAAALG